MSKSPTWLRCVQAEAMTKHYKTPILLIEFEADRAFALQAANDMDTDKKVSAVACAWPCPCLSRSPRRL